MIGLRLLFILVASLPFFHPAQFYRTSIPIEPHQATDSGNINAQIAVTLTDIAKDLRALKAKYPQLADIDRERSDGRQDGVVVTGGQLSYRHGEVRCGSKAKPCEFSSPTACDLVVNLQQVRTRDQLHQAVSQMFPLLDGTYLEYEFDVRAAPTGQGRRFSEAVGRLVDIRVKSFIKRLVRSWGN